MKLSSRLRLTDTLVILTGIFLLALALRLLSLDLRGLWRDEVQTLEVAQRGIAGIFSYRFGWLANQTPLYYLMIWLTSLPVDPTTSTLLVRLPSALAGALTSIAVLALGRELFGRWQGLLAALLIALSTAHLSYSQDLRPYSLVVFFTVTSVYCLVMAERTMTGKWWLAFTVATIANLLIAYIALTMVLPALAPYLAWALWRAWSNRNEYPKAFRYAALSISAIAFVSIVTLLQIVPVSKTSTVPGQFSLADTLTTIIGLVPWLLQWFTKFGFSGGFEHIFQWLLALFAVLGLYYAIRSGRGRGAALCTLFIIVGPAVFAIALASEKYVVYQRYAIFAMPFYFLLIGNGLVSTIQVFSGLNISTWANRTVKGFALAFTTFGIALFALGAYNYISPDNHHELTYRPDFRGVSQYLSQRVKPDDTLVFVVWDFTVSNYYWKGKQPASTFSALDPRLFKHEAKGDIYWVVSYDGSSPPKGVQQWSDVSYFEHIVVLREKSTSTDFSLNMEQFVARLAGTAVYDPGFEHTLRLLGGCIAQARGDVGQAATIYKKGGTYNPVGTESLATANGFIRYGYPYEAWRDAVGAKSDQPGSVELHAWLAQRLSVDGYAAEGRVESQIVELLQK